MTVHYIRLLVKSAFLTLYYFLGQKFGQCYRRCFKLEDGRLCGIIVGEKYSFDVNSDVAVTITLEEKDDDGVIMEIFSYAGGAGFARISWGVHKTFALNVVYTLRDYEFDYEILNEIDYFSPSKMPYDADGPIPISERRIPSILPERVVKLNPCPFLSLSLESPYKYVCNAKKLLKISKYTMSEKKVIKHCTGEQYRQCEYYAESLRTQNL